MLAADRLGRLASMTNRLSAFGSSEPFAEVHGALYAVFVTTPKPLAKVIPLRGVWELTPEQIEDIMLAPIVAFVEERAEHERALAERKRVEDASAADKDEPGEPE